MTSLDESITAWVRAEHAPDTISLDALLHPEFLGVGPYGFVLDRQQWIGRFEGGLRLDTLDFHPDTEPRMVGTAAVVVGTQTQEGTHQGRPIDGAFRVTLV